MKFNQDFFKQRLVVWDLETTGLTDKDKIIQFAGVEMINGEITRCFEQKIKPLEIKNGKEVVRDVGDSFKIHQIATEQLLDKPRLEEVVDDIIAFMKDSVIIAHNGNSFDAPFLNRELKFIGKNVKVEDFTFEKVDSLFLSRSFDAKQKEHKLDKIVERYSSPDLYKTLTVKDWKTGEDVKIDLKERETRHDALVDCALLAQLMKVVSEQWDFTLLKDFKNVKKMNFSPFELDDYEPVVATINEKEQQQNMAYLDALEKENGKKGVIPKMKEEMTKKLNRKL